jgi:hypothetical protein
MITVDARDFLLIKEAMAIYRREIRDDAGESLAKGGRLVTLALHRELRKQPPRPVEGSIEDAARTRGWKINSLSRSYLAGYSSALRTLGGAKSGYFRMVRTGKGTLVAQPIVIGRQGRRVLAGRKNFRQRGSLLTDRRQLSAARLRDIAKYRKFLLTADKNYSTFAGRQAKFRQQIADTSLPPDAVQLNLGALANVRAVNIREAAAAGGYLAAQFLTYKKMKSGPGRHTMLTKNNVLAGEVIMEDDNDGNLEKIIINGRLPGTGRIVERFGIVPKAIGEGARLYRDDMRLRLERRAQRVFGKVRAA